MDEISAIIEAASRNNVKHLAIPGVLEISFRGVSAAVRDSGLGETPLTVPAPDVPAGLTGGGGSKLTDDDLELLDGFRQSQTIIDNPVQFEADQIDACLDE